MGLDGVEILRRVEDTFDIEFSDAEENSVTTPGQLAALVTAKRQSDQGDSASDFVFSGLREALRTLSGQEQLRVEPSTQLCEVLPTVFEPDTWRRLEDLLGLRLPPVTAQAESRRRVLLLGLVPLTVVLLLVAPTALASFPSVEEAVRYTVPLALLACALGAIIVLLRLAVTRREVRKARMEYGTAGVLTARIVEWNTGLLCERRGGVDPDVWRQVRAIVAEQLGLEEHEVTMQARLVEDLGVR